jgi:hypothetical protein
MEKKNKNNAFAPMLQCFSAKFNRCIASHGKMEKEKDAMKRSYAGECKSLPNPFTKLRRRRGDALAPLCFFVLLIFVSVEREKRKKHSVLLYRDESGHASSPNWVRLFGCW